MDPRAMPAQEATEDFSREVKTEPKAVETTTINQDQPVTEETPNFELEALRIKNLELQKQKEHWKDKYDRDINNQKPPVIDDDSMSDEGRSLKANIASLEAKLASMETVQTIDKLAVQYPAIKDKQDEFEEFRSEYPGLALEKVAKIFVMEKGYNEQINPKIGLEKATSGAKSQQKQGLSMDEVKRLRESQPRRYQQMLKDGRINPDNIK